MQSLRAQYNVSLFMILVAFVNTLLNKLSGQQDIVVGLPVSGRTHPELERSIGLFVNTIAFRNKVDVRASFLQLLESVKKNLTTAFENSEYPFNKLLEDIRPETAPGHSPIYDVVVQMQDTNEAQQSNIYYLNNLSIQTMEADTVTSKVDLTFNFIEKVNAVHVDIEYNTDLFKEDTMLRIGKQLSFICDAVCKNPGIPLTVIQEKMNLQAHPHSSDYTQYINTVLSEDF